MTREQGPARPDVVDCPECGEPHIGTGGDVKTCGKCGHSWQPSARPARRVAAG
jgi:hypothetical protein